MNKNTAITDKTPVYGFDVQTGEVKPDNDGFAEAVCGKCQIEDIYLLADGQTTVNPPQAKKDYTAFYDRDSHSWDLVEDHRGKTIWESHGNPITVEETGPIPDGYSLEEPDPSLDMMRSVAVASVNAEKERRLQADYVFENMTIQTGADSLAAMNAFRDVTQPIEWIQADNSITSMTGEKFVNMVRAVNARNSHIILTARRLKDNILNMNNKEFKKFDTATISDDSTWD